MKSIKFLFIPLLFLSLYSFGQYPNKSSKKTILWHYELPKSYNNGPVDVSIKGYYYFTKIKLGDKYKVNLHWELSSIDFNPLSRYKYKGNIYTQNQLNAADALGFYGYSDIKITSISASISVSFLDYPQTAIISSSGPPVEVGKMDSDLDLEKLSLDLAGSYLTAVNWTGSTNLEARISNLNNPKKLENKETETKSGVSEKKSNNNSTPPKNDNQKTPTPPSKNISSTQSNKNTNTDKDNSSDSSNNSSSSNQNNTEYNIPSAENQMLQLGIDPNKNYAAEIAVMGVNLLQEINENRRLRWEKEAKEAERLEKRAKETGAILSKEYDGYLKYYYDKLIDKALQGDTNAQLQLVYKYVEINNALREELWKVNGERSSFKDIPILSSMYRYSEEWILALIDKGNIQAMNFAAKNSIKFNFDNEKKLELLIKVANAGSVEGMLQLGNFYADSAYYYYIQAKYAKRKDKKNYKILSDTFIRKMINTYELAAEKGSPGAMYFLGMIYLYGIEQQYSKFEDDRLNIPQNKLIALKWFEKSIDTSFIKISLNRYGLHNYKSEMAEGHNNPANALEHMSYAAACSNFIVPASYFELSKLYMKGFGDVNKDKIKAKKLYDEGKRLEKIYETWQWYSSPKDDWEAYRKI